MANVAVRNGLAQVLNLYGENYKVKYKLPLQHRKVMFAVQSCRTALLGGHVSKCTQCEATDVFYNSCRNRHCPKCQYLSRERWVDKLTAHLLPVKYFHIVFTIPSELNLLCLVNQQMLYDILFKAASETILILGKDKKHLGAETGLLAVLHTWGQTLIDHPHLHTLVPAGGWSHLNGYWKSTKRNYFVDAKVISQLFKGKFLYYLKQAFDSKELKFEGQLKSCGTQSGFRNLLRAVYNKDWVVYAKKPFKNSKAIVRYLGRYTHRVAITDQRITNVQNNTVSFTWKDYRCHGARKTMTVSAEEFIRRFLLHVLPSGYRRIRYYGLMSNKRSPFLNACKQNMCIKKVAPVLLKLRWNEQLKVLGHHDPLQCQRCKKGRMEISVSFKHNRAPPIAIC